MKLAICFYGQPRFFDSWSSFNEKFYKDCDLDFYAHFWGDEKQKQDLWNCFKFQDAIIENQVQTFKSLPCDVDMSRTNRDLFVSMSPLYSMQKVKSLIEKSNKKYDFWILTRTDVAMDSEYTLNKQNLNTNSIYTSYVAGKEWLTSCIDTKFIMGDKNSILNLTNIYNDLEEYICNKRLPMCHHHLYYVALTSQNKPIEMIVGDPNDSYVAGWRWVRNGQLSIS